MKRIAIFGGAFNPIHNGHIHLAMCLDARLSFEKILLIPTHTSPHKDSAQLASGEHRLAMCRLAARQQDERFDVSDMELARGGKSFTVDTVRQLRQMYPEDKLYMIVGSDMFLSLDSWHCAQELVRLVTVCAAAREDGEYGDLIVKQRLLDTRGVKSVVCPMTPMPISSTVIRERIQAGQTVDEYLPADVLAYIRQHQLYKRADG